MAFLAGLVVINSVPVADDQCRIAGKKFSMDIFAIGHSK